MYRQQMSTLLRVAIFPFTSLECYQRDYLKELAEAKSYGSYKKKYNNEFKEVLYRSLNQHYALHTLDYIDLLISKYYDYNNIQSKESHKICLEMLTKFAKSFVCHRNGRVALKYWESEKDEAFIGPYKGINKIALWNALNRMMCTDIIIIQYLLENNLNSPVYLRGYYSSIMLEDLQLEKVLTKGVAETHIHRGAGINFIISWTHLMNLSAANIDDYKACYLSNPLYEKREIQLTVAAMALVRLVMTHFFSINSNNFSAYLIHNFGMPDAHGGEEYSAEDKLVADLLIKIGQGQLIKENYITFYRIQELWEHLKERFNVKSVEDSYGAEEDYIGQFLESPKEIRTTGENVFLFRGLRYMQENAKDDYFSNLFFQYIRIKNVIFEAKVQENSISGLKNFQPFYNRSTYITDFDATHYWLTLIHSQFQNRHLKKLEFRFSFKDGKSGLKQVIVSFLEAYKIFLDERIQEQNRAELQSVNGRANIFTLEPAPQIGLVFHMIKSLDEQWYEKCWQNTYGLEDEQDIERELFYNKNQNLYKQQVEVFNQLRKEVRHLDKFLIGIDAASIEDNTEPWVFAPIYRGARNCNDNCMLYENGEEMQTLGFTFHVGEDFRHLLTGLRHVDEVIEHFSYHAGDRIGHGIVLGVDPTYWCRHNQIVMLPRGEYLDDLLWVWGVYKDKGHLEYLDISYLEQKIMQIAEEVFECIDGITVYMLWKVYQNKFEIFSPDKKFDCYSEESKKQDDEKANRVFCKYLPKRYKELGQHWSYEALRYVQHCKCYAKRLLEPIQIEVDMQSVNLYKYLQQLILDKINNKGIVIETNPTSNLAIGEMQDLFEHYIFNLNDLKQQDKHMRAIFSINSDDPSVFNTNVSNEIAYIFYALQKKGYSREEALQWIDKIRGYGMMSSFLLDEAITCEGMKSRIEYVLAKLKE